MILVVKHILSSALYHGERNNTLEKCFTLYTHFVFMYLFIKHNFSNFFSLLSRCVLLLGKERRKVIIKFTHTGIIALVVF